MFWENKARYWIKVGLRLLLRRSPNAAVMLGHRLRRWPSFTAASGERLVFTVKRFVFDENNYEICFIFNT